MSETKVQYRLLRVLEYVGDAEFVRNAVERRHVKGRFVVGGNSIQEAILGETAEILARVQDAPPSDPTILEKLHVWQVLT